MAHAEPVPPGAGAESVSVEVIYCPAPHHIDRTPLRLAPGSTAAQALQASGVLQRHGLDLAEVQIGIWGRACEPGQALRERDRVELYRPLLVDPKEARRQRYKGSRARREAASGQPAEPTGDSPTR